MKKKIEIIGFCIGWFAIITQFTLMLQNRQANITETIIRFFSFFTILTNLLVAIFFTYKMFKPSIKPLGIFNKKGTTTALTAFILIVGLVYQMALRGIWEPTGIQWLVDELLHSIIPLLFLIYWFIYGTKQNTNIRNVGIWLLYPIVYIVFVLVRGHFSSYYPYPFLNIPELGLGKVLPNVLLIFVFTLLVMLILVSIEKRLQKNKTL
ncbi:Pr6Pr family membrane protein [Mariniflexile sp.]|uniref:Pr6Pr family membrane protein n=1 Tax=Mariniflexile sp. TaxID=1979402 RepID=UPI0040483B4D